MNVLRILIADDESLHLMSLRAHLQNLGHRVIAEAGNGVEAVALARDLKPDLAVLDIRMPQMDGIEAAQTMMAERPLPIILLSAFSERDLAERATSAHVSAYLMKPVSESDLLPALALATSRFQEFQSLHKEVDDLRESLETRKLIERAKGVLMRRLKLSEEEAFKRLQKRSQDENKKMIEIARAIVTADEML